MKMKKTISAVRSLLALLETEARFESGMGGWSSAVRDPRGVIKAHDTHHDAWADYYAAQGLSDEDIVQKIMDLDHEEGSEEGFMSPEGEFHSREQALRRWKRDFPDKVKHAVADKRAWGDSTDIFGEDTALAPLPPPVTRIWEGGGFWLSPASQFYSVDHRDFEYSHEGWAWKCLGLTIPQAVEAGWIRVAVTELQGDFGDNVYWSGRSLNSAQHRALKDAAIELEMSLKRDRRPINEANESAKPPRGYRVTVRQVQKGWYDCMVWKGLSIALSTSGTMFETKEKARQCGNQRAWDMHLGRSQWT